MLCVLFPAGEQDKPGTGLMAPGLMRLLALCAAWEPARSATVQTSSRIGQPEAQSFVERRLASTPLVSLWLPDPVRVGSAASCLESALVGVVQRFLPSPAACAAAWPRCLRSWLLRSYRHRDTDKADSTVTTED